MPARQREVDGLIVCLLDMKNQPALLPARERHDIRVIFDPEEILPPYWRELDEKGQQAWRHLHDNIRKSVFKILLHASDDLLYEVDMDVVAELVLVGFDVISTAAFRHGERVNFGISPPHVFQIVDTTW
jgi:hypothetical protein